jgi:hypothetical protein
MEVFFFRRGLYLHKGNDCIDNLKKVNNECMNCHDVRKSGMKYFYKIFFRNTVQTQIHIHIRVITLMNIRTHILLL